MRYSNNRSKTSIPLILSPFTLMEGFRCLGDRRLRSQVWVIQIESIYTWTVSLCKYVNEVFIPFYVFFDSCYRQRPTTQKNPYYVTLLHRLSSILDTTP